MHAVDADLDQLFDDFNAELDALFEPHEQGHGVPPPPLPFILEEDAPEEAADQIPTIYDMDDQVWLQPETIPVDVCTDPAAREISAAGPTPPILGTKVFAMPVWALPSFIGLIPQPFQALVDTGAQHGVVGKEQYERIVAFLA